MTFSQGTFYCKIITGSLYPRDFAINVLVTEKRKLASSA